MSNLRPSSHAANSKLREHSGPRVTIRGRCPVALKDVILRAIEVGIHVNEAELVEAAVTRYVQEELEPALVTGNYDKTRQSMRRLDSLASSARNTASAEQTAQKLIEGAQRLVVNKDAEAVAHYLSAVEAELQGRATAWGRRVMLILNNHPKWLEMKGGR